jgi:DNA-binding MarR family transcriptional regulator
MADDTGHTAGYELPLLLFAGFRSLMDQSCAELARLGHPGIRPLHGFALRAVGPGGATAAGIARRLGVSHQAAAKAIGRLESLGYAERTADPADARRKLVLLTPRGLDALDRSTAVFEQSRAGWASALGAERLHALESDLRTMAPPGR